MITMLASAPKQIGRLLEQVWLVALLGAAWWFLSANTTSVFFPPLSKISQSLVNGFTSGTMLRDLMFSLSNILIGIAVATIIGVVVGILIGELERLRQVLDPFLQFVRSVPQSALIPIVIGALGIGQAPKIYMIGFACFWPVLLNTIDGVRSIAPEVRDMARSYRIPTVMRIRKVVLPAALPQIVAGVRVSLAVGVVIMVVSEIFSAVAGIGHYINMAGSSFDISGAWAGTLLVGALGYVLSSSFNLIEKGMLRWYFDSAALASQGRTKTTRSRRKEKK